MAIKTPANGSSAARTAAAVVLRLPANGKACERAQRLAGKTLEATEAPKLPFRDCGRMDCQCRYETVSERRRRLRREDEERRDAIRFEDKPLRRNTADRRKRNTTWNSR